MLRKIFPFVFVLLVIGAFSPLILKQFQPTLPTLGNLPAFELIDQTGQKFSSEQLKGKVSLTSFFFASCHGPCPTTNSNLAKIIEKFRDKPDFMIASISVDPENDTPEILREYAAKFSVSPANWHFLTGTLDQVKKLVAEGYNLGDPEDLISHSTRLALADREGQIRAYYRALEPEDVVALEQGISTLLNE